MHMVAQAAVGDRCSASAMPATNFMHAVLPAMLHASRRARPSPTVCCRHAAWRLALPPAAAYAHASPQLQQPPEGQAGRPCAYRNCTQGPCTYTQHNVQEPPQPDCVVPVLNSQTNSCYTGFCTMPQHVLCWCANLALLHTPWLSCPPAARTARPHAGGVSLLGWGEEGVGVHSGCQDLDQQTGDTHTMWPPGGHMHGQAQGACRVTTAAPSALVPCANTGSSRRLLRLPATYSAHHSAVRPRPPAILACPAHTPFPAWPCTTGACPLHAGAGAVRVSQRRLQHAHRAPSVSSTSCLQPVLLQ